MYMHNNLQYLNKYTNEPEQMRISNTKNKV